MLICEWMQTTLYGIIMECNLLCISKVREIKKDYSFDLYRSISIISMHGLNGWSSMDYRALCYWVRVLSDIKKYITYWFS